MPTIVSQSTLDELGRLIGVACEKGDTISAIAERAGVPHTTISALKNGSYRFSPTLDKFEAVCAAIGVQLVLRPADKRRS